MNDAALFFDGMTAGLLGGHHSVVRGHELLHLHLLFDAKSDELIASL